MSQKSSEEYARKICEIISKDNPKSNKNKLFNLIFEILWDNAELDDDIWDEVCNSNCNGEQIKDMLQRLFYTKSKLLIRPVSLSPYKMDVPSILFLELLIHLIQSISKTAYNKEKLEGLIITINRSDNSGILNIGIDNVDFFLQITKENREKIPRLLQDIDKAFTDKDIRREGNYSLGHVLGGYCKGILQKNHGLESSLSPTDDMYESDSDEDDTVHVELPRVATKEEEDEFDRIQLERTHPSDTRPMCKYGVGCARRSNGKEPTSELHFVKFRHPMGFIPVDNRPDYKPHWKPGGGSRRAKSRKSNKQTKNAKRTTRCLRSSYKRTRRHTRSRRR
jgi:hypothetical protein